MSSPPPSSTTKTHYLCLLWQLLTSTLLYLLLTAPSLPFLLPLSLLFSLSLLLFSLSLSLLSSPHPHSTASFPFLSTFLLKFLLGGFSNPNYTLDARRRVARSLAVAAFLVLCSVSGFLAVVAVCGRREVELGNMWLIMRIGVWGVVLGLVYGGDFVWRKRWLLRFPIVERPLYYRFKIEFLSSVKHALKLSTLAFVCSAVLGIFQSNNFMWKRAEGRLIVPCVYFYCGTSAILICWELSYHLLQLVYTRRCSFALPQGSAVAKTKPTELLLKALEQSTPRSLLQYLAYLDLCVVSDSNVEPWRRAAFYEESGETYRRIISVCLRPLEQLTSKIGEGLEGLSLDNSAPLTQLHSPADTHVHLKLHEAFSDLQICTWCARIVVALTVCSPQEDRFGVAQLTRCNSAVITTLLSTLLAVEACLGKKTNLQPTNLGPTGIRWAGKKGEIAGLQYRKRGDMVYAQAYVMADVLKTSIYHIISSFQSHVLANPKASILENNWIMDGQLPFSTREILVQKLVLFMEFHAN